MKKIISFILAVSTLMGVMSVAPVYADQLDTGVYNFECVAGGRYLNVYAGYDYDGANVCVWSKDGSAEQKFKLTDRGGNRYVLTPQSSKSGRVLDANRGNSYRNPLRAGNNIDIWRANDQPAQEWYIDNRGNGNYTIELVNARGLVVTCDNPWVNNGNCSLQQYNGSSNQLWKLHKLGGGSSQSTSSSVNTSGYKTGTYKVKYNGTNIRSGAGLGYSVVSTVNGGRQVNVTKVSGEWGYIPSLGGWLRLNGYADYIGSSSSASSSSSNKTTNQNSGSTSNKTQTSNKTNSSTSKHNHSYKTFIGSRIDDKYHNTVKKCVTCGNVASTNKGNHKTTGNPLRYEKYNENKHYAVYVCKDSKGEGCGATVKKLYSHKMKRLDPVDKNVTYHTVTKVCEQCGYKKTEEQKHSYSGSKCKCGRSKSNGLSAARKNGVGECANWGIFLGDAFIYSKCPKCGSAECTIVGKKKIKSNLPTVGGGARKTIYHQYVKCRCGKNYYNRCYSE